MYPRGFVCKRCGHCCLNLDAYATTCTAEDFRRWEEAGRADILRWVSIVNFGKGDKVYEVWMHPERFDHVSRCPWLTRMPGNALYECAIDDVKPGVCRDYPYTVEHAMLTGCRGFDHLQPRQFVATVLSQSETPRLPDSFWSMVADVSLAEPGV